MSDKEYSKFVWAILAILIAAAFTPGWKAFAAVLGWMVVITLTDIQRAIQNKDKDLHR